MDNKKIIIGFLTILLLGTGIVITFQDNLRIEVERDSTQFKVPRVDIPWFWKISGEEENRLFDGTSIMQRDLSGIEINHTIDNDTQEVWITRKTPYKRGPVIIETYYFKGDVKDVELFPIYHKVNIINGSGYFYRYTVDELEDTGEKKKFYNQTEWSFGNNMKVEVDSGYRWAWIGWPYGSDSLSVQYDIDSDNETFNVRLFDPITQENLLAYFKLDEISGNVIESHSGSDKTNNGLIRGKEGILKKAFEMDGSGQDYISTGFSANEVLNGSVSMWVKPKQIPESTNIMFFNSGTDSWNEMRLGIDSNGYFKFGIYDDSELQRCFSTFSPNISEWYHIVASWGSEGMKLYVNGNLEAENASYTGSGSFETFYIGKINSQQTLFNGSVDEVALFNESLNSTQVSDLYQSRKALPYPFWSPYPASLVAPSNGLDITSNSVNLNVTLEDPDGDTMNASFYSKKEWDIETYEYNSVNINTVGSTSEGLFFRPDGTNLYEVDRGSNRIYQFSCTDAHNLSSCTYDNLNISTQGGNSRGVFLKPDGTKLYEVDYDTDEMYQYTCSTPWEVDTCTYDNVNLSTQDGRPTDLFFKPDGTKLYETGHDNNRFYQYSCTTPWVLDSCTYDSVFLGTQVGTVFGMYFDNSGTYLYEVDSNTYTAFQYNCTTPWDLSTCAYTSKSLTLTSSTFPSGITFKPDGTKLYEINPTNNKIYEYDLGFSVMNTQTNIANGSNINYTWEGLESDTTYEWYVNTTDGENYTSSEIWNFSIVNISITLNSPTDSQTNLFVNPLLNISASHIDGNNLNISFYDDSHNLLNQSLNVVGGSNSVHRWSYLDTSTTYNWYVNVTSGDETTQSSIYSFTTGDINASLNTNITFTFNPVNNTQSGVEPVGQNDSNGAFYIVNDFSENIGIVVKVNETNDDITIKVGNSSNYSESNEISSNHTIVYTGLTSSSTCELWIWADYANPANKWTPEVEIAPIE